MQSATGAKITASRETSVSDISILAAVRVNATTKMLREDEPAIHVGFSLCSWSEDPRVEEVLKELKVTIRCVPLEGDNEPGKCIFTGGPSAKRAVFAKAY